MNNNISRCSTFIENQICSLLCSYHWSTHLMVHSACLVPEPHHLCMLLMELPGLELLPVTELLATQLLLPELLFLFQVLQIGQSI